MWHLPCLRACLTRHPSNQPTERAARRSSPLVNWDRSLPSSRYVQDEHTESHTFVLHWGAIWGPHLNSPPLEWAGLDTNGLWFLHRPVVLWIQPDMLSSSHFLKNPCWIQCISIWNTINVLPIIKSTKLIELFPRMLLCPNDLGKNCKVYTYAACFTAMNSYSVISSNISMDKSPEMNS